MNPRGHHWFSKLSVLLCLLTAHSSLSQSAGDLFRADAKTESCGGFAVPVKPASVKIAERQDLGLDSAKTRAGFSTPLFAVAANAAQQQFRGEILANTDPSGRPESGLLLIHSGRAPPSFNLL